jgi:hypothetical protein
LQQIVQAVVAAVTAAQKPTEPIGGTVAHVPNNAIVVSALAPSVVQQTADASNQNGPDAQDGGSKGKEAEGPGPSKKK